MRIDHTICVMGRIREKTYAFFLNELKQIGLMDKIAEQEHVKWADIITFVYPVW